MHIRAALWSIVFLIHGVTSFDYCEPWLCRKGVKHIACGHNGKFASICPRKVKIMTKLGDLRHHLIRTHNAKRNRIAGGGVAKLKPACRMATMQWDSELAELAALNVRQCNMSHDKCHNTAKFHHSGQNLAYMKFNVRVNHTQRLRQSVQVWYDEVQHVQQKHIDKYPKRYTGPVIGHFTVMMADRNDRLGCAASIFTKSRLTHYLVACNYATSNILNFPIYAKCSKATQNCKTGRNAKYTNLCSPAEKYAVNTFP